MQVEWKELVFIGVITLLGSWFFLQNDHLSAAPQLQTSDWIECAAEGEMCSLPNETIPQRYTVRYGNSDGYAYLEDVSGSVMCNADEFGSLPSSMVKICSYWAGDPAPTGFSGSPFYPNQSSQISCQAESVTNNVWVVNPDNDSVAILDTMIEPGSGHVLLNQQQERFLNFREPTSVTQIDSYMAITFRDDDKVVFYDEASTSPAFTIDTGHGTQPVSSVADDSSLYVALFGSGEVIQIDVNSRAIVQRVEVGPMPKGMALHDGRLLVTRFISPSTHGEVYDLETSPNLALIRTITVNKVLVNDGLNHGSGVPNFMSSIVINPEGTEAYIPAVKANVDRGMSSASNGNALDDDNTVRPMMVTLDLENNQDSNQIPLSPENTTDFDNQADPAGITLLVDGVSRIVTFTGNNVVFARNEVINTSTQFSAGMAPQEMCATERTLYVKNFTGRTVSAIDVADYMSTGQRNPHILTINTVSDETLTAEELNGLQLFYSAAPPEMGPEGYISCASCHKDGGQDGQVWDLTSLGEGLRNTISLNGTSGTRFGDLHWSANFDEVQDFELQIEQLNKGDGLVPEQTFNGESPLEMAMTGRSEDLDALAAYVASLGNHSVKRSPYRTYTGELSDAAVRGQQIFMAQNCASCHTGSAFRDGQTHDVGTISETSGGRLDGTLSAIRTPPLIELWETAPYFHDGSAATLADVFDVGFHQLSLSVSEEAGLIEFLLSIDQDMFIEDDAVFPEQ
ncbi:MAG: hypothetical protein AAGD96_23930 [Chloroflexota bacterium]